MTEQQKIHIPDNLTELLNVLTVAHVAFKKAYQNLEMHNEKFNPAWENRTDNRPYDEDSIIRFEIIGQELVDDLEHKKLDLIIAAQVLALHWQNVSIPF